MLQTRISTLFYVSGDICHIISSVINQKDFSHHMNTSEMSNLPGQQADCYVDGIFICLNRFILMFPTLVVTVSRIFVCVIVIVISMSSLYQLFIV